MHQRWLMDALSVALESTNYCILLDSLEDVRIESISGKNAIPNSQVGLNWCY